MSGFLTRRVESDDSTYAGSVMLEGLRAEILASDEKILTQAFETIDEQTNDPDSKWGSIVSVLNKIPQQKGLRGSIDTAIYQSGNAYYQSTEYDGLQTCPSGVTTHRSVELQSP